MKVRMDFVTNSSSSSFIMGRPGGNKLTIKDAVEYLSDIQKRLGIDGIFYEHIIDLKHDEHRKYLTAEVQLVVEALEWYSEEIEESDVQSDSEGSYGDGSFWFVDEDYEYHEMTLDPFKNDYTKEEVKWIFDKAHRELGEILVGSIEIPFIPYEAYDEAIRHDDRLKFKCNHMG